MCTRLTSTLFGSLTLLALAAVSGCGSSATTNTSPTSLTRCSVSVSNGSAGQVPAQGGSGTVAVSAARECAWSASVDGQWLSIKNGATGQGDGAIEFNATANTDPAIRRGAIVLNEQRVEVIQAAAECAYTLSESSRSFGQTGGQGAFDVRASSSLCTWAVQADSPWIQLRTGTSGKGTAAVEFEIAPGSGVPRAGTITAAGLRFTVTQTAGCNYAVNPTSHAVASGGGAVTVSVTTTPACPWTANSASSWITLTTPPSATGSGVATFSVAGTSASRSGSVVVAGQTVAISQTAGCSFAISPEQLNVPASGSASTVNVTAQSGCGWSTASNVPWISLRSNGPESGAGSVQVTVAPNTGAARVGTATVAGRTLTVSQAASAVPEPPPIPPPTPPTACTYKVSPLEVKANEDGAVRRIEVRAADRCAWTASSNVGWIRLSPTSGTGDGEIYLLVGENDGRDRSGTVTIAGQTVTVTQKGDD